ncbi:uncharacterized protein LOC118277170 [Spodoptera frugiperda]|uniref:Uncharacterized protein LOC118277170 n=1 Tax=Spodoptera frugiperda TaxID=7108 RepID=A0A9R0DFW3_SPOFR|nr:uncharacterized protein LOC118277170 [Spodoptera frugiperda]
MRNFIIIIAVLTALVACYGDAITESLEEMSLVYDEEDTSMNGRLLSSADVDSRNTTWVVISEWQLSAPAVAGQVQRVGVMYEGAANVTINRLTVTYTETPAAVDRSPLSTNVMNVMIRSHAGQQVNATVTILRRA